MLKDDVYKGLENGSVKIISSPNDGCVACKIGDYWFYFMGIEEENMTPNEVLNSYTREELCNLIYSAMIELDDIEIAYYVAVMNGGEIDGSNT